MGREPVFTATVRLDVDGVPAGNTMRLSNALRSFLRRFPDTATELNVDVEPYDRRYKHPELWDRALWDMVFWTRPSFTDLVFAAKTDLDVKKLVATAFLAHAARRCVSMSATAQSPLNISLTWALDGVREGRRSGLKEIAEELQVLVDVLARGALPEACVLDLTIVSTDNAAFARCVKTLSEGQATGGKTMDQAETAVRMHLGRVLTVLDVVEVIVNDRGGECETLVLERCL
ncbi:hypothetical protein C8Q76DRAFT_732719 [Earliella scabrosa]|nr:hypothetical protein C8Q76DRAFT_732719 [Earliella scabrosa]